MNAVGIGVSKGKSIVGVVRPFGELVVKPFEVRHTSSELSELASSLKNLEGETKVVLEHTGRYYESAAQMLHALEFLSARSIRCSSRNTAFAGVDPGANQSGTYEAKKAHALPSAVPRSYEKHSLYS